MAGSFTHIPLARKLHGAVVFLALRNLVGFAKMAFEKIEEYPEDTGTDNLSDGNRGYWHRLFLTFFGAIDSCLEALPAGFSSPRLPPLQELACELRPYVGDESQFAKLLETLQRAIDSPEKSQELPDTFAWIDRWFFHSATQFPTSRLRVADFWVLSKQLSMLATWKMHKDYDTGILPLTIGKRNGDNVASADAEYYVAASEYLMEGPLISVVLSALDLSLGFHDDDVEVDFMQNGRVTSGDARISGTQYGIPACLTPMFAEIDPFYPLAFRMAQLKTEAFKRRDEEYTVTFEIDCKDLARGRLLKLVTAEAILTSAAYWIESAVSEDLNPTRYNPRNQATVAQYADKYGVKVDIPSTYYGIAMAIDIIHERIADCHNYQGTMA